MKIVNLFKKEEIIAGAKYELVVDLLGGKLQKGEVFEVTQNNEEGIWVINYKGEGMFSRKEFKKYFKLLEQEENQDSEYVVNEDNDEEIKPEESSNEVDKEDFEENNSTEEDISDYEEISWDDEE